MNETSQKQVEANQENAKKGGVKTDEGKDKANTTHSNTVYCRDRS